MTYYCTLMERSATDPTKIVESCGSITNFNIDGRLGKDNARKVAMVHLRKENRLAKRGRYVGYKLAKGSSWSCLDNVSVTMADKHETSNAG